MRQHLVDVKPDGTFRLDMQYFEYATGLRMTSEWFDELFGGPARKPDQPIDQRTMALAASVQQVTDEIVLRHHSLPHESMPDERGRSRCGPW